MKEPKSIHEKVGGYVVKRESVVNHEGLFGNHFRISHEEHTENPPVRAIREFFLCFRVMKSENVKKSSPKPTYLA